MAENVEVLLLNSLRYGVRDDLFDGLCSQLVLDGAVVPEVVDDEVVAVLLRDVDVGDILLCIPNLIVNDDLDDDPNVVSNISDIDPDIIY